MGDICKSERGKVLTLTRYLLTKENIACQIMRATFHYNRDTVDSFSEKYFRSIP